MGSKRLFQSRVAVCASFRPIPVLHWNSFSRGTAARKHCIYSKSVIAGRRDDAFSQAHGTLLILR